MIVVDTSTIGYSCLFSERSEQAELALKRDLDWVAPLLWKSELRNVPAACLRLGSVGIEDAIHIISEAEDLMKDSEYGIASAQILRLA